MNDINRYIATKLNLFKTFKKALHIFHDFISNGFPNGSNQLLSTIFLR